MKYTILLPLVALLLISCNNTAETKSQTKETIKKEINRQRDKSNNNEIGTFHQHMFRNINNCVVPISGWDIIYTNPNEPHNKIYVELKNKHS